MLIRLLASNLLLALTYFGLAWIGMAIAEPPGYSAPVWLPAGVAFFAVLSRGRVALPGVWLGSFLVHCWINWDRSEALLSPGTPVAVLIGAGAALQAWVGAALVRKALGFPPPLTRGSAILAFLLIAGPASCLLNATASVGLLCLSSAFPWSLFPTKWLDWWVGDSLGVLIVGIMLLPAIGEPRDFWRPRVLQVTVPIGLLTALVLVLFGAVRKAERDRIEESLTTCAAKSTRAFILWFGNARVGVSDWADQVRDVPEQSVRARADDARRLLEYHDTLRALAVLEVVRDEDRPGRAAPIVEPDADGVTVPSPRRAWYAVPTSWNSLDRTPPPTGVDFAYIDEARDLLLRAAETAEPVAIPARRLPFLAGDPNDLAIFQSLYRTGTPPRSPAERRATLRGFSLSIVRMDRVLERSMEEADVPVQVGLAVESPAADGPGVAVPSLVVKNAQYVVRVPAALGLADAVLTYRAGAEYFAQVRSRYVGVIFLLGLIIVGLFGVQLLLVTGETAIVTEEVRRRTAELRAEVAERERAEAERRLFEDKLRETQKLESLGVLAGGIAHDFNNILTSILGYAGLGERQLPPGSPVRAYLGHIDRSSRRAADLCQQMLAYAGKGRFVVGPLDLGRLVADAADLLRLSISKKAALTLDLAPGLPPVEADANQLRQVVMNLVMNASESLGEGGGSIALATGLRAFDRAALDAMLHGGGLPAGDYVVLEVVDSGCGMDAASLGRIFEPFYTTKFAGRGLGLAAVLGIMRGHGGALCVESTPGRGTSFRLLFPPSRVPSVAPEPHAPAHEEPQGRGTVLVADDEESVRGLTVALLESIGFATLEAGDGEEAVAQFAKHQGGLRAVILDLTMPRLDGQQAFAEIHRRAPDTPVLLMTGYTEDELRTRFTGARPAAFLQKPFGAEELIAALGAALSPGTSGFRS